MSADLVRVTTEGVVCTLLLDRPEVRNAMSRAMVDELRAGLAAAVADDAVRVVVVRGNGGHFCAGGDIQDMARVHQIAVEDGAPDPVVELNASFGHMTRAFLEAPKPVVAVCEGVVMGGGFGLACAADVTLASPTVDLRLPETGLGVVPAQIAPVLLRRMTVAEANRLALTGARIDAKRALASGIVHEVDEDVDALLARTVSRLIRGAPGALAATKVLFNRLAPPPDEAMIQLAAEVFAKATRSPEATEGTTAFLQKRKPSWAEG
ncbi:MAG: enoyl-CoA hydratase-related protein [Myxococcota bacterium]